MQTVSDGKNKIIQSAIQVRGAFCQIPDNARPRVGNLKAIHLLKGLSLYLPKGCEEGMAVLLA